MIKLNSFPAKRNSDVLTYSLYHVRRTQERVVCSSIFPESIRTISLIIHPRISINTISLSHNLFCFLCIWFLGRNHVCFFNLLSLPFLRHLGSLVTTLGCRRWPASSEDSSILLRLCFVGLPARELEVSFWACLCWCIRAILWNLRCMQCFLSEAPFHVVI